jgi:hypothetical protein
VWSFELPHQLHSFLLLLTITIPFTIIIPSCFLLLHTITIPFTIIIPSCFCTPSPFLSPSSILSASAHHQACVTS